ncbi:MAG: efflux RND transporter periplasmic adaptor subunit [Bacteroidia bacterium]|nr:efflux RND transporter periplasmic adaptor subunit [Bacteroidia bacterium]
MKKKIIKVKSIKMKKVVLLMAITALIASCSQPDKKAQLEKLKAQHEALTKQIEKLEVEIKKDMGDSVEVKANLVEVLSVAPEIFSTYIDVQGKVDADENVALSSEMPGTVTKINVKVGDEVSKGQVLAETDSRAIQQGISDLQTNVDLVNQLYEKQKNLWEQKIGTEVQFLQAKTNKESLEKKMATLQEQLRMSKIISPIDGTVDAVDIKVGNAIAPGIPAIRVINFANLKVKAELAESYAGRVKKNDIAKVYFPDLNDSVESKVNYASRAINPMSRTFTAEVLLDNKKEYHPNMVTRLKINDYVSSQPVVVIPVRVIQNSTTGERYVYVVKDDKAVKSVIKTGREYNGKVEVKEGLAAGDLLVTMGFENVNEGDKVAYNK